MKIILLLMLLLKEYSCKNATQLFNQIDEDFMEDRRISTLNTWNNFIKSNRSVPIGVLENSEWLRSEIQDYYCGYLEKVYDSPRLKCSYKRQAYLICRGLRYNQTEVRDIFESVNLMRQVYDKTIVCLPDKYQIYRGFIDLAMDPVIYHAMMSISHGNTSIYRQCRDEFAMDKLMGESRSPDELKMLWLAWREKVGPPIKRLYAELVKIENQVSKKNGYKDIGAVWRTQLEMPFLKQVCHRLYTSIKPLYALLHGVVRYYLRQFYEDEVPKHGPIPAHLLGSLWSQNWEPIIDLLAKRHMELDEAMNRNNWTVTHMVTRVDDFYQSLGMPRLTPDFYENSRFSKIDNNTTCHPISFNLLGKAQYRLSYCAGISMKDFDVLHHEMGHIHYFRAYEHQPYVLKEANPLFFDSVGDAIMLGALTPQHLNRLGLVNDSVLFNVKEHIKKNPKYDLTQFTTDELLLLRTALYKLPQIPYNLVLDEFRWKYFEGMDPETINKEYWKLSEMYQGIKPPIARSEHYFDAGSNYDVSDNKPTISRFLSGFFQHQLFERLCKASVFGSKDILDKLPESVIMHRCDIYGSKAAGKVLESIMSSGGSKHWQDLLYETTKKRDISALPLAKYYLPLYKALARFVEENDVPIGW